MEVYIALIGIIISLLYFYIKHTLSYWKRRKIPHETPHFPLGNLKEWRKTKHLVEILNPIYAKYKGTSPYVGFYFLMRPTIIALDLNFIKNILIKDFDKFDDRGMFNNEDVDILSGHLFRLDGHKWRPLRHKLTPTFTSGKMKFMFPTVVSVGATLVKVFEENCLTAKDGILEITDIVGRFTADVIGTCAFGLECNSLCNPNAEFCVYGKRSFIDHHHGKLIDGFIEAFPSLAHKLHMRQTHTDLEKFYTRIVKETVEYREKNKIERNDFMHLLIEMKNSQENGITLNEIIAQSFVFFVAGYETSSTTMAFALYELAQHQDIQEKMRTEISEVLKRHNNEFTYEFINELKYVKQVMYETLRKYPILPHLRRRSNAHYTMADSKYDIEVDTKIIIPIYAIHYDPDIYPEPHKFIPERFSDEEIRKRPACSWLPFGEGPRNCIGLRFGKMQTSIGLAYLIKNFKFSLCNETPKELKWDLSNLLLSFVNGLYLKVERINEN
ncbi:probable cytochrome P450 6a23 [Teleopsis dalmanni]|uniref:probable cytochrome P450 6a23 n=1 Tax=Teleopsis dalmanni TaxID=139649 RepID=UPI0018CD7B08|nr:probable cytochrome P450 6a23 [Teleopsis dalmanni]